jgi:hypothetical protein
VLGWWARGEDLDRGRGEQELDFVLALIFGEEVAFESLQAGRVLSDRGLSSSFVKQEASECF